MTKLEKAVQQFVLEAAKFTLVRVDSVTYNDNGTATVEYKQAYYDEQNDLWQVLSYDVTLNENGDIL
ncbi:TPA: hypothetical protein QB298_000166 [Pasteurella multocida]|nr:hypothetical protein [Pasteurella multocida]